MSAANPDSISSKSAASKIPPGKVNLKMILVSGKTSEFLFNPSDTACLITQHVFDNWPQATEPDRMYLPIMSSMNTVAIGKTMQRLNEPIPTTDWADEAKPETNILRLIYQGRFLHDNVSLGALHLQTGKTTVMHLVARENLPEPNNKGNLKKDKGVARSGTTTTNSRRENSCCSLS